GDSRGQRPAIRRERDPRDFIHAEDEDSPAARQVLYLDLIIPAAVGQPAPVRRERQRHHTLGLAEGPDLLACGAVPDRDLSPFLRAGGARLPAAGRGAPRPPP